MRRPRTSPADAVVRSSFYKYHHPKECLVSNGILNRYTAGPAFFAAVSSGAALLHSLAPPYLNCQ
jgi:hypothetical protein